MKYSIAKQTSMALLLSSAAISQSSFAATFTGLGFLPGSTDSSSAGDVSLNGVVVGNANNAAGKQEAFRWTASTGMQGLGILGANPAGNLRSYANGVSADGSVITGGTSSSAVTATSSSSTELCRWTAGGGMVGLGLLPGGGSSNGTGISNDGNAIVGYGSAPGYNTLQSAVWTSTGGLQVIGDLPGGDAFSYAWAISGDGSTIAGLGTNSSNQTEAFQWTQSGGIVGLGVPAGNARSEAYGINNDGSIIVGDYGNNALLRQAAYWTEAGGWVGIGTMGYNSASATSLTDDGSIIVGNASTFNQLTQIRTADGFFWDAVNGMRSIDTVLSTVYGIDLTGWDLTGVSSISNDGRFIVGSGTDPNGKSQAWIADLHPVPVPGAVWLFGSAMAGLIGVSRRKTA